MQADAFFLPCEPAEAGQRFCIFHPAAAQQNALPKGLILYIHPFAEEMNKSRRMAALQARAMAKAGYAVLQIDLLGCGDSSGDFGDATWDAWLDDVALGLKFLRSRATVPPVPGGPVTADLANLPVWLWGLRAGCLLAVDAAKLLNEPCNFLFWQAPASGKALLQQFLRLKVAGDLAGGQGKAMMEETRRQLTAGASVEVAGYSLSAGLANGLENSVLEPRNALMPGPAQRRLEWLEVSTRDAASFSPISEKTIATWGAGQFAVRAQIARGPSFWQTQEIEDAPDLVEKTLQALGGARS